MTTRRVFLKTLAGIGAGYFCYRFLPFIKNSTNTEYPLLSLAKTDKTMPQHLSTATTLSTTTGQHRRLSEQPGRHLSTASNLSTTHTLLNAPTYTLTPTYDHSGQAVHPSVIDFKTEHGLESWGGFRYWMAFTPYPNFNYTLENPSLLVSNDGLTWINPPEIKNPVAPRPFGGLLFATYNSDPELLYDPEQNTLILYWREYRREAYEKIWAKKFNPDYKESAKILCFEKPWHHSIGLVLSPTVWRKSAKEWYMWTTNGEFLAHLSTSTNGFTWSIGEPCSSPWDTWNGGYLPWHIAAKPNYLEQKIEFLIAGWPKKGSVYNCELLYATAPMAEPLNLSMPLQQPLLKASGQNQWDNGLIYRSSFVMESGEAPNYRIWYSACSEHKVWHIGYTEGRIEKTSPSSEPKANLKKV